PEQWTGQAPTPACDIYAATATFYECLTGRPPYDGNGDITVLRRQHEQANIPTDPAPRPLHGLLRGGLAKRPDERPQSAAAFLDLLETVAGAAYGPDWEERGRRKLAERAALLAALFPFANAAGGGTAVAATVLGVGRSLPRKALIAAGVVGALLLGGVGLNAAVGEPTTVNASATQSPSPSASRRPSPSPSASPPPSPTPDDSPTPSASPTPIGQPTPGRTTAGPPHRTSSPPRTSAPAPNPPATSQPPT